VRALAEVNCSAEEAVARAEALADALGELIGKSLEKPTARSIGKLFQKHLTGRPAWIDDGKAVATLRRIAGHNANEYQVRVSVPGQSGADEAKASHGASFPGADHPVFSENPSAGEGKVGNEGNVSSGQCGEEREKPLEETTERPAWRSRI
jgi:hypothetical protein